MGPSQRVFIGNYLSYYINYKHIFIQYTFTDWKCTAELHKEMSLI